jgi:hypothetical protein
MNTLIYLLQVTACTAVFYLFYFLFLSKLTFFTTNRWYLLVTILLSFLIPWLRVTFNEQQPYVAAVQHMIYMRQTVPTDTQVVIQQVPIAPEPIHWDIILRMAYFAMAAALGIHLFITLLSFLKHIKGKRIAKIGKVNVLSGQQKIANGSFLNYIFLNEEELSADEIAQIIAHEMLHIKLYHSADRILVKIAQIILWFNPFIYLYARSVEENHEFEVDREIARSTDKHNYANLLLHLSVAGQGMLYHNFSKVPLKKRISMLFNKPSNKMKRITYVLIVPVVLLSCLAFARLKKANAPAINTKNQYYTRLHLKKKDGTYFDKIVVSMPSGDKITHEFSPKDKIGFLLGGETFNGWKVYNEEEFKTILPSIITSFTGISFTTRGLGINGKRINGYDIFISFGMKKSDTNNIDTTRKTIYRQKIKRTAAEIALYKKQQEEYARYQQTADYKNKMKLVDAIAGKTITVTVKGTIPDKVYRGKQRAILAMYNGQELAIASRYGQEKALVNMIKPGDQIELKVFESGVRSDYPVMIIPAYVIKNKVKIFQLAEAGKIPDYPFLYEANKVRFTDGQVSNILKYPNGKWKSALFETVNGYKFNLNFKPSAPDLNSIESGDHVRLRFVHEVKTGAKTYRINDWVSITTNIKDYGIKNPEFFNRFYTEIKNATALKSSAVGNPIASAKNSLITQKIKILNESIRRVIEKQRLEAKKKSKVINQQAENNLPIDQYYKRRHFINKDGSYYDQIEIYKFPYVDVMHSLSLTDKPGFIIDKKIYNEEEFKKILPSVIDSFSSGVGTGTGGANDSFLNHGLDVSGYDVIFSFNTKKPGDSKDIALSSTLKEVLEKMRAFEKGKGKELPERNHNISPQSKDTVNNSGHTKQRESHTTQPNETMKQFGNIIIGNQSGILAPIIIPYGFELKKYM